SSARCRQMAPRTLPSAVPTARRCTSARRPGCTRSIWLFLGYPTEPAGALALLSEMVLSTTSHGAEPKPWTRLFNDKDLSGWDTYLGPAYDPVAKEFAGAPLGLNNDPEHVFSTV